MAFSVLWAISVITVFAYGDLDQISLMNIIELEKTLSCGKKNQFKIELLAALTKIENGYVVLGNYQKHDSHTAKPAHSGFYPLRKTAPFFENQKAVDRLANLITKFLSDPELSLNRTEMLQFIYSKTLLSDIFYISNYENMDHILEKRNLWSKNEGFKLKSDSDVYLALICWNLNSVIDLPFPVLKQRIPETLAAALVSAMYSHEQFLTARSYETFESVMAAFLDLPDELNLKGSLPHLINIWMGCSYWDTPKRHEIKKKVNKILRHTFNRIKPAAKNKPDNNSPRVAILMEKYKSTHAMYRCYHRPISELKANFKTCLFATKSDYDVTSAADFGEVIQVDGSLDKISETIKKVEEYEPDIILYPSLGMSFWTVPLANFRLAPIQIMAYGHPASAMTETIDFGILIGHSKGPDYQALCEEKLITLFDEHLVFAPHPETDYEIRSQISADGITRVAVNSSLMKVSDRVLSVCQLLAQNSDHPLEFHFFPAHQRGFKLLAFQKKLSRTLTSNCIVHEPKPYFQYLTSLASCDFAIGTFPFGGTNTNIDAILLELPKVYISGKEDLASFTDLNDFKNISQSEGFRVNTELEMIAQAIIWSHNSEELKSAKLYMRQVRNKLLDQFAHGGTDRSFTNAINEALTTSITDTIT